MRLSLSLFLLAGLFFSQPEAARAVDNNLHAHLAVANRDLFLSPYWPPSIQQWDSLIYKVAYVNGLDPDLVAAVVSAESDGFATATSEMGAVGLMGVMPVGPGLEWRPSAEVLADPRENMQWGVAILTDILQQTGGDIAAALAAYNAGWRNAGDEIPQTYTAEVLDEYGRAVVARAGGDPAIAAQWTVGIELRRGNVAPESLLVFGKQTAAGGPMYGGHVVYKHVAADGTALYVRGFAVPLTLLVAAEEIGPTTAAGGEVDAAVGEVVPATVAAKGEGRNPLVVMACLPTLSRLRGHLSTRWFAPSSCPTGHR